MCIRELHHMVTDRSVTARVTHSYNYNVTERSFGAHWIPQCGPGNKVSDAKVKVSDAKVKASAERVKASAVEVRHGRCATNIGEAGLVGPMSHWPSAVLKHIFFTST